MYFQIFLFYNLGILAIVSQSAAKPVKHATFHKLHPHHQHHLSQESQPETTDHFSQSQEPMPEMRLRNSIQSSGEPDMPINVSPDEHADVHETEEDGETWARLMLKHTPEV